MLWQECKAMIRLAVPIAVLQIGLVLFGVVDTFFMGRLGPQAIAAVGLGHAVIFSLFIFGIGCLYGVDSLVSRAVGAGDEARGARIFLHAIVLAFLIALLNFFVSMLGAEWALRAVGIDPDMINVAMRYLDIAQWMYFPGLIFVACRLYLQSHSIVRPLLYVLMGANVLNAVLNYGLVFGNLGMPRLEVQGCAIATVASNILMMLLVLLIVARQMRQRGLSPGKLSGELLRDLLALGIPGGIQSLFEVGVFSFVSIVMGKLGALPLAAHQITLNLASVTFMIPLGVSFAAAVRVGYGFGGQDRQRAAAAGWSALILSMAFMSFTCALFFLIPETLIGLYTTDADVLEIGATLLFVAGIFQVADGAQVALTGMLRGLGDTKKSMVANLISHWLIGFPLGYYLTFYTDLGAQGLWIGLCIGLSGVALFLQWEWRRRLRQV